MRFSSFTAALATATAVLAGAPTDPCTAQAIADLRQELTDPDLCPPSFTDCGCHKLAHTVPLCRQCPENQACTTLQQELRQDCVVTETCDAENVRGVPTRKQELCPDRAPCACPQLETVEKACSGCFPRTPATEETTKRCGDILRWYLPQCYGERLALHTNAPNLVPVAPTTNGPLPIFDVGNNGAECTVEYLSSFPSRLSKESVCTTTSDKTCECQILDVSLVLCRPCVLKKVRFGDSPETHACDAVKRHTGYVCRETHTLAPDTTQRPTASPHPNCLQLSGYQEFADVLPDGRYSKENTKTLFGLPTYWKEGSEDSFIFYCNNSASTASEKWCWESHFGTTTALESYQSKMQNNNCDSWMRTKHSCSCAETDIMLVDDAWQWPRTTQNAKTSVCY